MNAVVNASPLIVLAKADLLELLPRSFEQVAVPQGVLAEIAAGPAADPLRQQLDNCAWLRAVNVELSPVAVWSLGRGETEVIEWARVRRDWVAVLDDRAARRAARVVGITAWGTLGLVARAVARGQTRLTFDEATQRLTAAGLFLDPETIAQVRRELP